MGTGQKAIMEERSQAMDLHEKDHEAWGVGAAEEEQTHKKREKKRMEL